MTHRQFAGLARAVTALALVALAAGGALAQSLGESLESLLRSTREYQESLRNLLALQTEAAERAEASAEKYRRIHRDGLVSRRDVERAEDQAAEARARAAATRERMDEAERVAVEARALIRLAALPPVAPGDERATPEVVEYRGVSDWTLAQVAGLERFFAARFGRPLPVSALGQTALHDRLGFDHRNALDVALHPDTTEGRALLDHLRGRRVPFLAFRGAVPGVSTGAHVHVGPPSPRKG
jgi:hypothetical protein